MGQAVRRPAATPTRQVPGATSSRRRANSVCLEDPLDLSDFLSYKGAAVNHMVAVARRIAVARKAAGITQRHLATELQITREYLARLETARQPMSLRLLVQLAAALR